MVGFNEGNFKLTPHKYKLTMMATTKFTKVTANKVPMNVFEFMPFKDILASVEEEKVTGTSLYIFVRVFGCYCARHTH